MTWQILVTVLLFAVPTFFGLAPSVAGYGNAKPGYGALAVSLLFLGAGLASVVSVFWLALLLVWS